MTTPPFDVNKNLEEAIKEGLVITGATVEIFWLLKIVKIASPSKAALDGSDIIKLSGGQFNYCPLIWMCHNRTNDRKINRLHERCLRIIYNDKQSSFIELLEKDNSVSIHQRNLQVLAIEMFKVSNGLSPVLMNGDKHLLTKR